MSVVIHFNKVSHQTASVHSNAMKPVFVTICVPVGH